MATANAARSCPFSNPSADFDPFDISNPFEFYAWARAEAPVFFSDTLQYYVVSRHADIKAVFEDWQTFSSENAQAPLRPLSAAAKNVMRDGGFTAYSGLSARVPPEHTRIRRLVQGCFGPRRFRSIEPQIREIVTTAIDGLVDKGQADFFREFAYDVPALVLFKLVGVPDTDVPRVKEWAVSRALLTWGNLTDEEQIPHAHNMVHYWNYCRALVAARHVEITDDLPGDLVRLQQDGAEISDDEIAGVLYSILFAGHETTTTLMANGVRELLLHRASWQALIDDPALIPNAVDEILRFSPSIVAWRRKALKDARIGDTPIAAGADILLLLGSANRDEAAFPDGARLDITRKNARNNLSFGYGIHFCVGQQLAKIEFGIALEELTRRLPSLRLQPNQRFEFARNTSFRVPTALHVAWDRVPATSGPFTLRFDQATPHDHASMGGKCASLAKMIAAGVRVPEGFAVTTAAYAAHLRGSAIGDAMAAILKTIDPDRPGEADRKSAEVRAIILAAPMPAAVEAAIRAGYRAMSPGDDLPVAVRSSATAEDMPDASFAGQQDTYLWVVGADAVVDRVRACWASLFNARAIAYRAANGIDHLDVEMAVGVQKMVDAASAGVAMTLDPINGDRTRIVIDAAFGLGEPVVSGEITPDNFVVEKVLLEIVKRRVAEKDHELIADRAARKTVDRVIEASRRTLPSLTDAQIIAVARLAKSLEKQMGCPQDVEWAIDRDLPEGDDVVALQSRPETIWSRKKAAGARSYTTGIEGVIGALLSPLQVKQ